MRIINGLTAAVVGIVVAALLAPIDLLWPAAVIGVGASAAAIVLLGFRRSGRKRYALAGTAYCLGLAGAITALGRFPTEYSHSPAVALGLFGVISLVIVGAQSAGRRVVRRFFARIGSEETGEAVYNAVAAVVGLFGVMWAVLNAYERALRYGGLGLGVSGSLVLNLLGAEFPIPVWFLSDGVDATMVLFVGCTLIGFHTLESLHTTWYATKQVSAAGASASRSAGAKAVSTAQGLRNRGDDS